MTKGEMHLALLAQQAQILSKAFPEFKEYRTAATMLNNALNAGLSRGVSFVGSLDGKFLQNVARQISNASRQQAPASKIGFLGRKSLADGIGVIPVNDRLQACLDAGGLGPANLAKCTKAARIEQILNDGIEKSGHHVLYKNLKTSDNLPSEVGLKKLLHQTGVEGMALSGSLNVPLMYEWVETAILNKNVQGNVGPYSSRETSFIFGRKEAIGEPISVTVLAIATLISAALGGAAALLKELRSEKAYAMSEARGFGTDALSAKEEDWLSGGGNNTLILVAAAAAGIYFLTDN